VLPRQHRLHLSADLRRVNRRGRRFVVSEAVLTVLQIPKTTRVGVITPGKIGNSVTRHQIARKVRAAAAVFIEKHPVGLEVVVRAQTGAETLLVADWIDLFERSLKNEKAL
jgi:ribonuclease P protein component